MKIAKEIINSPIARSAFYVVFVGGLFTLSSFGFTYLCNWAVMDMFSWPCLSFLESAGILSFAYIAFFSFKFGFQGSKSDNVASDKVSKKGHSVYSDDGEINNVENLTENDRERLKRELAKQIRMN